VPSTLGYSTLKREHTNTHIKRNLDYATAPDVTPSHVTPPSLFTNVT
jgi:hypothetical protein